MFWKSHRKLSVFDHQDNHQSVKLLKKPRLLYHRFRIKLRTSLGFQRVTKRSSQFTVWWQSWNRNPSAFPPQEWSWQREIHEEIEQLHPTEIQFLHYLANTCSWISFQTQRFQPPTLHMWFTKEFAVVDKHGTFPSRTSNEQVHSLQLILFPIGIGVTYFYSKLMTQ